MRDWDADPARDVIDVRRSRAWRSRRAPGRRGAAAGMALFYVARYAGPEAAGAGAEAEAEADGRARALLERLQCRARERQRQQQSRPQEPEEAAQTEGAASRRRRRRPRRCKGGGAPGSPQAPRSKRRREAGEEAGAGGPGGARGDGARTRDPGRLEADAPPARLPPAESSEEAPREGSGAAEAAGPPGTPGERPPGEARGPPAHALLLGGFGRSRAPTVSGLEAGGPGPGGSCRAGRCQPAGLRGGEGRRVPALPASIGEQRRSCVSARVLQVFC